MLNQKTPSHQTPTRKIQLWIKNELLNMKFDGMMEKAVLDHWRDHEPKRVEQLLLNQSLKKALEDKVSALLDLRQALQKTDGLDPVLARMEAWNRLMKPEAEEAEQTSA